MAEKSIKEKYPWLFLDKKLKVDLIYDFFEEDEDNEKESKAAQDTVNIAMELVKALEDMGHIVTTTAIKKEIMREQLGSLTGDVVFNLVEEDILGFEVLKYLEELKKIVTGVDSVGYKLSWDKGRTKELLIEAGVSTPKFVVIKPDEEMKIEGLTFPLFVKAADDHGSLSINQKSKVNNREELVSQVKWVKDNIGGPALVEEYIEGRELGVTVLGNDEKMVLLPIKEILFGKEFEGKVKVVTYDGKWNSESSDYAGLMSMDCPALLEEEESAEIEKMVRKSCLALGVRDYVRFDIRLRDGVPYIIDYNANPALGSEDASGLPVKRFGMTYPEFISAIVAVAVARDV